MVLNSAVVMPYTEARTGLDAVQNLSNALVGLLVVSSGIIGSYAVVARRERSWVIWVAILVLAVVLVLMMLGLTEAG